uniref:Olfactory receptor family 52 subfamily B member 1 n=1 Tax=Cricetulus griseus TaxID=10029 RepID=A0A8C2MEA6_CRIGR
GANLTIIHPTLFILLGIPGLEQYHTCECTLHEPMCVFLSMLVGTDILLSTTTVPKALATFWFHAGEIPFDACITQIFFIHVALCLSQESCWLWHLTAICMPLRYSAILTPMAIRKMTLAIWGWSILPIVFLLKRLLYSYWCRQVYLVWLLSADGFSFVDVALIVISYTLILQGVFRLPSQDARHKSLNTCGSHIGIILLFFIPSFFTFLTPALTKQIRDSMTHLLSVVCKS